MNLVFRPFQDRDFEFLVSYMFGLYEEDPGGEEMELEKIQKTIQTLRERPSLGEIVVFEMDQQIVGYALLINYWSNEYGGMIVNLDELYVQKAFRNQGIASRFIQYLVNRSEEEIAFELEVMPNNKKALKLYLSLGFEIDQNTHLIYD